MKILILQDYLRSGGTERQSVLLARDFRARGHDAVLLTFRPGGPLRPTLEPAAFRTLQAFDTRLDWFAPRLGLRVRRERPDIVLAMGRMANCHLGWVAPAARSGVAIATYRTGKSLPWIYRRSLRLASHVIANSAEGAANLNTRYGVDPAKVSVIHNSLVFEALPSSSVDAESRAALRRQHGAAPDTAVFLSVAMFRPEKNQRELIELVSGLPSEPDWQFWLAGDGPSRSVCEARAAALGLGSRVKFLGFIPDPRPLYAAADAALHASQSEALSNFLIEAQAHGLPVIAYDTQGIGECFSPETGWLIPSGDRPAFRAAATALLHSSPATREAQATLARSFARTHFDPDRQIEAHLSLFTSLLNR